MERDYQKNNSFCFLDARSVPRHKGHGYQTLRHIEAGSRFSLDALAIVLLSQIARGTTVETERNLDKSRPEYVPNPSTPLNYGRPLARYHVKQPDGNGRR